MTRKEGRVIRCAVKAQGTGVAPVGWMNCVRGGLDHWLAHPEASLDDPTIHSTVKLRAFSTTNRWIGMGPAIIAVPRADQHDPTQAASPPFHCQTRRPTPACLRSGHPVVPSRDIAEVLPALLQYGGNGYVAVS